MVANVRNNSRGQIIIQIKQMLLQIVQRSSLGHVIRILVEIPEPHFFVLPVSESNRCHRRRFYRYCFSGSMPGRNKRWALRGKRAGAELRSSPRRIRPLAEKKGKKEEWSDREERHRTPTHSRRARAGVSPRRVAELVFWAIVGGQEVRRRNSASSARRSRCDVSAG